jgi:uncharacterized membrane protein YfcA
VGQVNLEGWVSLDQVGPGVSWPGLVVMGAGVGLVSGLFGVGGGFLLTPLLSVVFSVPMPIAVGSGLCQMVGTATIATLKYRQGGQGEPRFALLMLPGSLLGVAAGARVVEVLDRSGSLEISGRSLPVAQLGLYAAYIAFLSGVALLLWHQSRRGLGALDLIRRGPLSRLRLRPLIDLPSVPMTGVSAPGIAYLGLVLGLFSGLLGISGGIVLIPILLYGYGFPFRQAAGTGIAVTLVTAVFGTWLHALQGHVSLPLALILLIGSGLSARVGVVITRRLEVRRLRLGLLVLVSLTNVMIVVDLLRHWL